MTDQDRASFDPRIADWLEGDPNTAPEPTLEIVLAAFPSTKQRRGSRLPWRFSLMPTSFKLALGAAAVVVVVLGGAFALGPRSPNGVGGPGSTPSPSPSITSVPSSSPEAQATVPTDWKPYTSSRFAYTVDYPVAWGVTPATQDWPSIGFPENGGEGLDNFGPKPFGIQVWVSSVALKTGADEADWITAVDDVNDAFCNQTSNRHDITVDGATLRQEDQVCGQTYNIIEVVGAGRGRFYKINLVKNDNSAPTAADRATFDRFLASFRFAE
jgi:hypothetical protein